MSKSNKWTLAVFIIAGLYLAWLISTYGNTAPPASESSDYTGSSAGPSDEINIDDADAPMSQSSGAELSEDAKEVLDTVLGAPEVSSNNVDFIAESLERASSFPWKFERGVRSPSNHADVMYSTTKNGETCVLLRYKDKLDADWDWQEMSPAQEFTLWRGEFKGNYFILGGESRNSYCVTAALRVLRW